MKFIARASLFISTLAFAACAPLPSKVTSTQSAEVEVPPTKDAETRPTTFSQALARYALPKGIVTATVTVDMNTKTVTAVDVKTDIAPDPESGSQYWLFAALGNSRSDDLAVTIENGLLKSVSIGTTDQSASIALSIASTLNTATGQSAPVTGVSAATTGATAKTATWPIALDAKLAGWIELAEAPDYGLLLARVNNAGSGPTRCASGNPVLLYRPLTEYSLTLGKKDAGKNYGTVARWSVLLPDPQQKLCIPLAEFRLVKTQYTIAFDRGILTEMKLNKPSTGLAAAQLPASFLKAILAIPGSIFSLRVNYDTSDKAAIEAEKAYLQSQLQLLEERNKLEAAKQQTQ